MTIDAVQVRLDPGGAEASTGGADDSMRMIARQDALGADAWPGFTPAAARKT